MNYVGRKIYYDKFTGNVLVDTGEMMGDVRETTIEEDFQIYKVLSERNPETVGVIQLNYGEYSDKFGYYNYHIDTATENIVWGDLINPDIQPSAPTLEEQIEQLKQDNLILMDALATTFEEILILEEKINALQGGTA